MIFGKFMLVRNAARFVIPSYSIHLSVYKAANQKQVKEVDSEEKKKKTRKDPKSEGPKSEKCKVIFSRYDWLTRRW